MVAAIRKQLVGHLLLLRAERGVERLRRGQQRVRPRRGGGEELLAMLQARWEWAFAGFLPAGISDGVDDFIARRFNQQSRLGAYLDPMADKLLLVSVFVVMGFITFGVFLALLVRPRHYMRDADMRMLMAFSLPPVAIIAVVAFLTHANANWAAPSAIAMTILATAILVAEERRRWLMASVVIGLVVQAVLLTGDHIADRVTIPGIRNGDVYARTMGWHRLGDDVAVTAKAHGAHGIAADTRDLVSSLIYYTRDSGLPVFAWPPSIVPSHEFDISRPLKATSPAPILFVTECPLPARLTAQFGSVTSLGPVTMVRGPTSRRRTNP